MSGFYVSGGVMRAVLAFILLGFFAYLYSKYSKKELLGPVLSAAIILLCWFGVFTLLNLLA